MSVKLGICIYESTRMLIIIQCGISSPSSWFSSSWRCFFIKFSRWGFNCHSSHTPVVFSNILYIIIALRAYVRPFSSCYLLTSGTRSAAIRSKNTLPVLGRRQPSVHAFKRIKPTFYSSHVFLHASFTCWMTKESHGWFRSVVFGGKYRSVVLILFASGRTSSLSIWEL